MAPKPYILLDAGGVLLFPNPHVLADTARHHGADVQADCFYEGHYHAVHAYDTLARERGGLPAIGLYDYFNALFERAGLDQEDRAAAIEDLLERDAKQSIWTFTHPWVEPAIGALKAAGYRISVVSNSDGRVADQLKHVGLADFFERIFDSGVVGVEKPDPAIFNYALGELGLAAEDALYCGDIYHVDVAGANGAGIGAVQVDPFGLYDSWPGLRLKDIGALQAALEDGVSQSALFPVSRPA